MRIDQDRAAQLIGIDRWRVVYHFTDTDSRHHTETIAWFELTARSAWAEAGAQLPPVGYHRPRTVTVHLGTFIRNPEGDIGWTDHGPSLSATASGDDRLVFHDEDHTETVPTDQIAAGTPAGQQALAL